MIRPTIHHTSSGIFNFFSASAYDTMSKSTDLSLKMPVLPYSFNALEPFMDSLSLRNHFYNFHIASYMKLLELLETNGENYDIEMLFSEINDINNEKLFYAGVLYNHQLFWKNLSPYGGEIEGDLQKAINNEFGSVYNFKLELLTKALRHTSNGWIWLALDNRQRMRIITTLSNINPLMEISPENGTPLLAIDLWEHAFIHNFRCDKKEYLKKILMIINWKEVNNRYTEAL